MFFSFCEAWHVLSILCMRREIPWACLTLIYRQPMPRIAAASEACGLVCCTVYTNRGEAAVLHLGLPLPQVYFRLLEMFALYLFWIVVLESATEHCLHYFFNQWNSECHTLRLDKIYQTYHSVSRYLWQGSYAHACCLHV